MNLSCLAIFPPFSLAVSPHNKCLTPWLTAAEFHGQFHLLPAVAFVEKCVLNLAE